MRGQTNSLHIIGSSNVIYYRDLLEDLEMAIMSEIATEKEYYMFLKLVEWYANDIEKGE